MATLKKTLAGAKYSTEQICLPGSAHCSYCMNSQLHTEQVHVRNIFNSWWNAKLHGRNSQCSLLTNYGHDLLVHLFSYSSGQVQNHGNWPKRVTFSWLSSACGIAATRSILLVCSVLKFDHQNGFPSQFQSQNTYCSLSLASQTSVKHWVFFPICSVNFRGSQLVRFWVYLSNW